MSVFGIPLLMPLSLMFPVNDNRYAGFPEIDAKPLYTFSEPEIIALYTGISDSGDGGGFLFSADLVLHRNGTGNLMLLASIGLMAVITGLQMIMNVVHRFSPVLVSSPEKAESHTVEIH